MTDPATPNAVRSWDLPVRLTHWGLVLCLTGCYLSGKFGWPSMEWHYRFGYGALGLVLFRIVWGFVGGGHARFTQFLRGPGAVYRHLRELLSGDRTHLTAGHNPAGGWSVVLLLLLTGIQAVLGLFTSDDIQFFGPLSERIDGATMAAISSWHRTLELWLLLLIAVHLLAILAYWLLRREALLPAMFSGIKRGLPAAAAAPPQRAPVWLGWLLAALVVAAIWALLTFWPEGSSVTDDYGI